MRQIFPYRMPTLLLSLGIQILGCFVLWLCYPPIASQAQAAAPITPSGLNTQVDLSQTPPAGITQYDITGGTRPGDGANLFHSFGDFNVPHITIANFLNESGMTTSNILGRVTGGNISNIFGTIQTTGFGNANLFLMNSAGFLFGPNATINVGGMMAFTSADYIKLADGTRFNLIPSTSADALLTASPIAAFGFLGSNPGAITVQGSQFTVTEGAGISLIGGDIRVQSGTLDNGTVQPARLIAPGGQTNLTSVASAGEVSMNIGGGQPPRSTIGGHTDFGNISLSQGASIDTSADTAGRIFIRAGHLMMDDASIKAISVNGQGGGNNTPKTSPAISITAETIVLRNGALIRADSHGRGAGGDITLNVDTLTTQAGVNRLPLNPTNNFNFAGNFIASDSRSMDAGAGPAGKITIQGVGGPGTAATSVLLKDTSISSRIFGGTAATMPSAITITADSLVLTNEGLPGGGRAATIVANTIGPAPAGHIALNVNTLRGNVNPDETPIEGSKTVFIITNNDPGDTAGPTGTITISGIRPESTDAARLVVLDNTHISSGVDGGTTRTAPGTITITTDTLSLSNDAGIFTSTFGEATTPAGNILLNVNTLRAHIRPDGTLITGKPRVFIDSSSESGQAGSVTISGIGPETTDAAKQLALNNIELNTVVFGGTPNTPPATITLRADSIHLTDSKNIKTDTRGAAPAGNLVFTANTFLADEATKISSSSSAAGPGGTITITADQSVVLNNGSSISASSTGAGNAGNISINAGHQLDVMGNSSVKTEAAQTSGGNIDIQAVDSIRLVNSSISTSVLGGVGSGGNITIDPNVVVLQNSQVIAQAVQGAGGNITITTPLFLADSGSLLSASSQLGLNGNVTIQSPTSNLSESLGTLPSQPSQAQALLTQRCAALANGQTSSFVVAGREQLPSNHGGWLTSPLAFAALGESLDSGPAVASIPAVMAIAADDTSTVSLRRLTPAGFLMANFADSAATGCHS